VAYNLKQLHKLLNPANQKPKAPKTPQPIPSALDELLGLLLSHYCPALQSTSPRSGALRSLSRGAHVFGLDELATVQLRFKSDRLLGLSSRGPSGRSAFASSLPVLTSIVRCYRELSQKTVRKITIPSVSRQFLGSDFSYKKYCGSDCEERRRFLAMIGHTV
jgi:hypothetical protein